MTVTPIAANGNSSKFDVVTKRGNFIIALSFTLRNKVWQLVDAAAELAAATELAEAIVSRHDPKLPFKPVYVFGDHNSESTLSLAVQQIRKHGIDRPL